jgi:glycine/D-amino acid oxidase-like deaminating enzyme
MGWEERPRAGLRKMPAALDDVELTPFWLDSPEAPDPAPPLTGFHDCDLAVVGGGFSGLWTALLAKERDPRRDVVLLEAGRVGWQASGRNGGFCMASLGTGTVDAVAQSPNEADRLEKLGQENLEEIGATVKARSIDCGWESTGELFVATERWHVPQLTEERDAMVRAGRRHEWFDREAIRDEVASPLYEAGLWSKDSCAMVDPARLAWGLVRACREEGVRVYEGTPVTALARNGGGVRLSTPAGSVRAARVALGTGTSAFPSLLRRLRPLAVPFWDYALMTEPLNEEQRGSLGWRRRQGMSDGGNRYHYFRLTHDDRILWGGYDFIYRYGSGVRPEFSRREATFAKLAEHLVTMFPQLEGVRFTHAWGGVIDSTTRFRPVFGRAMGGRLAYALGHSHGVSTTRLGARVMLDLLSGERTELTELGLVKSRPVPWPPEPLRWAAIEVTLRAVTNADNRGGRRGGWLRLLNRLGMA